MTPSNPSPASRPTTTVADLLDVTSSPNRNLQCFQHGDSSSPADGDGAARRHLLPRLPRHIRQKMRRRPQGTVAPTRQSRNDRIGRIGSSKKKRRWLVQRIQCTSWNMRIKIYALQAGLIGKPGHPSIGLCTALFSLLYHMASLDHPRRELLL